MKFTIVFTALLCVSTSWTKKVEEPKDKREAPVGYGAPSHSYQAPASYSQGDASAISVGAGYSIGGQSKPTYSFGGHGSSGGLQISSDGLSPNGHGTIQLAPITLQPGQFSGNDFSQIMSQLSHQLNTGALSLQPSNAVAEYHQSGEGAHGISQGQEQLLVPQFSYGSPKYELSQQLSSAPIYSTGTKGLGSYTSTGPVLFTPNEQHSAGQAGASFSYGGASSGQSLGDANAYSLGNAGHSFGGLGQSFGGSGHSFGDSGHSLGASGHSLGGSGHSLGAPSHSLGGSGQYLGLSSNSLGGSGHSLAGLGGAGHSFGGSYKQLSGNYAAPTKNSFKPSAFLGVSSQGDSGHGVSTLSGSYSSPSFGAIRGSHGGLSSLGSSSHGGVSFGNSLGGFGKGFSQQFAAPVYQSGKSEGLEGSSSLSSHYASPPGTTYGSPSSAYTSNNVYAASSSRPLFVSASKYRASPGSFGQGSTAYRAPAASHSSLSSYSSGPKYTFSSSSPYETSDAHGSASETSYNTIKYSEEMKPRVN